MARKSTRFARLHAATDRQSGERVLIKPQMHGGYVVGGPDPSREEMQVIAYVALIPASVRTAGNAANSGHNAQLRMTADTIKYQTSALPYAVAEGDLVQLVEAVDTPIYRVSRTAPFGTDRTILFMVPTSR